MWPEGKHGPEAVGTERCVVGLLLKALTGRPRSGSPGFQKLALNMRTEGALERSTSALTTALLE